MVMRLPAVTMFALLSKGYKNQVYDRRFTLNVAEYPNMDEEDRQVLISSLSLPEDILGDILEDNKADDINSLKDIF